MSAAKKKPVVREWLTPYEVSVLVGAPGAKPHDIYMAKMSLGSAYPRGYVPRFGGTIAPIEEFERAFAKSLSRPLAHVLGLKYGLKIVSSSWSSRMGPIHCKPPGPWMSAEDKNGKPEGPVLTYAIFDRNVAKEWASGCALYARAEAQALMASIMRRDQVGRTYSKVYVQAYVIGQGLRDYKVLHDSSAAADVEVTANDFVDTYVKRRVPPPMDGSDAADAYLRARWPSSNEILEDATPEVGAHVGLYLESRTRRDTAEAQTKLYEQKLKDLIGESRGFLGDGFKVTWATKDRGLPKWKQIAEALSRGEGPLNDDLVDRLRGEPARQFRVTSRDDEDE